MNELDMQKYVVDSVNHAGGFAFKMSHRFLVGVPDLLVKLPTEYLKMQMENKRPAGILEVKQRDKPKSDIEFGLDVTPQQRHFLIRARQAGMPTGVISFMQERGKGVKGLHMAIYTLTRIEQLDYCVWVRDHKPVATEAQVIGQLVAWHRDCGK